MKVVKRIVLIAGLLILGSFLIGPNTEPSVPVIKAGKVDISSTRGSYCWKGPFSGTCVDKALSSSMDMAREYKPVEVAPNSKIKIHLKKEPIQGSLTAERWTDEKNSQTAEISNGEFIVPNQSGIYAYHIFARWKNGDASYAFLIEVK